MSDLLSSAHGIAGDFWNWIAKDSISFFTAVLAFATAGLVFTAKRQVTLMERAEATSAKLAEVSERQMLQSGMQTEILDSDALHFDRLGVVPLVGRDDVY